MPVELTVFSKFKLSETLSDEQTVSNFKKKFAKTLPMNCVDIVLVHTLSEPAGNGNDTPEPGKIVESEMRSTVHSNLLGKK